MDNILIWSVLALIAMILSITAVIPLFVIFVVYAALLGKETLVRYLINVSTAFDQLVSAVIGFNEDTTISGNIGYRIEAGTATAIERLICMVLDRLQKDHCKINIERDEMHYNLFVDASKKNRNGGLK